jgi:16S rRNA processing protein RimM
MDTEDPVRFQDKPLRLVGRVASAHGIKGEISVHPLTRDPARFFDLERILTSSGRARDDAVKPRKIESVRLHKGRVLLKLEGVQTRDDALSLIGQEIYVPVEEQLELAKGEYFIDSLVGLTAVDQTGRPVGVVSDVDDIPGNPVITLKTPGGAEVMIPFRKTFVLSVDLKLSRLVLSEAFGELMKPVEVH